MERNLTAQIKHATVAVGLLMEKTEGRSFVTVGSGFCVDNEGVIITCRHVVECFHEKRFSDVTKDLPTDRISSFEMKGARPFVFFYTPDLVAKNLFVFPVPVETGCALTDFDLGVLRIRKHNAFQNGYPTIPLADHADLYEGAEIGTCGFPLGNGLEDQIGTLTSSFTFGRLSSVIPAQSVPVQYLKGFQLDLTATHGNSGGPVFLVSSGKAFGVLQGGRV